MGGGSGQTSDGLERAEDIHMLGQAGGLQLGGPDSTPFEQGDG